ncbi:MAG: hypothetical protein IK139_01315 [Lachnospiraceae bacterium]|nr:hypothetical protein [Lachnospiraceae bacterium]
MTRKEGLKLLVSRVPEDKREAFVAELREAKSKEDRMNAAKKYNATLTEEEAKAIKNDTANEVSDEDLDTAAGGCSTCNQNCDCYCSCSCN